MTSFTASGGGPVRSSSPRITMAASSWAGTSRSDPPNPPTGVRTGSQMTPSRIGRPSQPWLYKVLKILTSEPLGDERGPLRPLQLDRHREHHLQGVRDLGDLGEVDVRPDPGADGHRRG